MPSKITNGVIRILLRRRAYIAPRLVVITLGLGTTASILGQSTPEATFSIPRGMKQDSSLVPLSRLEKDSGLLAHAIKEDSSSELKGTKIFLDDFLIAQQSFGDLGQSTMVKARLGSEYCGATGNCPFWLYLLHNERYEQILEDGVIGWAYAFVASRSGIPDLIVISNGGGGRQTLVRYRLQHGRFTENACEDLTAKNSQTGADWFDSSQVKITPCNEYSR